MKKNEYDHARATIKKEFGIDVSFKPVFKNPHMENSEIKFNFEITFTFNSLSSTFYFSQACREPNHYGKRSVSHLNKCRRNLQAENNFPDLWSVMDCLCSDAECLEYTFKEWAENFGFDDDSIKAKNTYDTCVRQTIEIKRLVDLERVAQYLEKEERV